MAAKKAKKLSRKHTSSKKISHPQKTRKNWRGIILITVGLFLIIGASAYRMHSQRVLSFSSVPAQSSSHNPANVPELITLEKTNTALPVEETSINKGVWQISKNGASYLSSSSQPGSSGAIILYAHNKHELFGQLSSLKKDDTIVLKVKNGKRHLYSVIGYQVVAPSDIDVLKANKETLILYTCAGFADTKRLVVKAEPLEEM